MNFTLGCDPEVFVSKKSDGSLVSAHDLIPGTKHDPHKVPLGAIQPDGLAAEFNTDPVPLYDFESFNKNVVSVLRTLKKQLGDDYNIVVQPSVQFDKDYYDSLPDTAKELGCDPDFCAYSEDPFLPNTRPNGDAGLRSGAGHIHIGWGADIPTDHPDHINVCRRIIRQLDATVGMGMICIDSDTRRRELYGKAGAYRPKSYGVEYRTPSNAWLVDHKYRQFIHQLVNWAINDMLRAGRAGNHSSLYERLTAGTWGKEYSDIQSIINNGDVEKARFIVNNFIGYLVPAVAVKTRKAS